MAKLDRKDVIPVLLAGIIIGFLLYAGYKLIVDEPIFGSPAAAAQFDHSQCQYPNRETNPPDGCDNSDPARPECMKFGTEDCNIPVQDEPTPVSTPIVAPAPSDEVKIPSCKE